MMTDAEIAGYMNWRGPGAYTAHAMKRVRAAITEAERRILEEIRQEKTSAARYEFVRTLSPVRFAELFQENLRGKLTFDEIVDRERCKQGETKREPTRPVQRGFVT